MRRIIRNLPHHRTIVAQNVNVALSVSDWCLLETPILGNCLLPYKLKFVSSQAFQFWKRIGLNCYNVKSNVLEHTEVVLHCSSLWLPMLQNIHCIHKTRWGQDWNIVQQDHVSHRPGMKCSIFLYWQLFTNCYDLWLSILQSHHASIMRLMMTSKTTTALSPMSRGQT